MPSRKMATRSSVHRSQPSVVNGSLGTAIKRKGEPPEPTTPDKQLRLMTSTASTDLLGSPSGAAGSTASGAAAATAGAGAAATTTGGVADCKSSAPSQRRTPYRKLEFMPSTVHTAPGPPAASPPVSGSRVVQWWPPCEGPYCGVLQPVAKPAAHPVPEVPRQPFVFEPNLPGMFPSDMHKTLLCAISQTIPDVVQAERATSRIYADAFCKTWDWGCFGGKKVALSRVVHGVGYVFEDSRRGLEDAPELMWLRV